ncbi:hypothetical protein [Singulisphaera acidiphila]|uniref:Uncharacterized protein n=1 Tax=Singulisphaera acidiphila (strain ATCC BAA-1392 / DSM 18658 / VKM B-2454 / MOB10) TaxID=886293 RepID=L0DPC0_SINAD|nr:hypothetical protein [Singulisphaera acidiphila]AGA31219.1 hypothetical protein Sinac_7168 [Singulisphaera acidiphila DSM 18658]
MRDENPGSEPARHSGPDRAVAEREGPLNGSRGRPETSGWVIETVISPFHCLYQDALHFHTQSHLRLVRSESEASRLARGALLLYIASAEALVHQAAVELGRPELTALIADPGRPSPLADAWRLLPAIVAEGPTGAFDTELAPWPQFAEMLALRTSWLYPGPAAQRKAYYRSPRSDAAYEPLEPHQTPSGLPVSPDSLLYPRTGLPRDPYALRPRHLDTARSVLDAAIEGLDRRLGGALTRNQRHRKEPVRVVYPQQK